MRIAFVNDTFIEGRGADTVIYELARRLGEKHEVFVIASEADFPEENFKIIKIKSKKLFTGNTLKDSATYFPNIIRLRKEMKKIMKDKGVDVFSVHHSSLNPAFVGLPVVVTWHGSPPSENILRKRFNRFTLRSLRKNKQSTAVSKFLKGVLSEVVPSEKISVVYNGVSEDFKNKKLDKGFMFFVGRLEGHKRVNDIIALSKDLSYPLKIAGSGPLDNKLRAYAKAIGADKVEFLGRISREDLIKNHQECSFFVSGSEWEGFGLIFMESAACGKPSVGYRKGSIPEVVIDGKTGFLADNYGELNKKAKELINDVKLRKKMGKEAEKLSKKFGWEESVKGYEGVFRSFVK